MTQLQDIFSQMIDNSWILLCKSPLLNLCKKWNNIKDNFPIFHDELCIVCVRNFFKVFRACDVWSFHIVDVEDLGHLDCYVMWQGYWFWMFWRNILSSECWKSITVLLSVTTQMTCILFVTCLEVRFNTLKFCCKIMQVELQGKCRL